MHHPPPKAGPGVERARLSPDSALIVVDPKLIHSVPGVSVVPVAAGRAFLAFGEGRGLADLEVAVLDRLQQGDVSSTVRKELTVLHRRIRNWRRSRRLRFSTRSIIIVAPMRPLPRAGLPRAWSLALIIAEVGCGHSSDTAGPSSGTTAAASMRTGPVTGVPDAPEDAGERKWRGEALRERSVAAFSWSALAGRLVEIYRDVQSGGARTR